MKKWPRRAKIGQATLGAVFASAELPRSFRTKLHPKSRFQGCLEPTRLGTCRARPGAIRKPSWLHLRALLGDLKRPKIQLRLCRQIVPSAWCQVRKYPMPSARCPSPGCPQDLCAVEACTCLMHLLPSLRWAFRQPCAELTRAGFCSFELTCISSPCELIEEDLWNNAHIYIYIFK